MSADTRPSSWRGCTDADGAPKPADTFDGGKRPICGACALALLFPETLVQPWPAAPEIVADPPEYNTEPSVMFDAAGDGELLAVAGVTL